MSSGAPEPSGESRKSGWLAWAPVPTMSPVSSVYTRVATYEETPTLYPHFLQRKASGVFALSDSEAQREV